MKGIINFQKPVFALAMASLVLTAFISAENATAQSSDSGSAVSATKMGLKVGAVVYVNADKLNVRSQANLNAESVVGQLERNDQVQIVDLLDSSTKMVRISIIKSNSLSNSSGEALYVSADYLSASSSVVSSGSNGSKYIIIQNVATERMRVYERCTSAPGCANRMVFETEFVAGRGEGDKNDGLAYVTWLGRFKITDWVKFYQDGAAQYPSWYDPNYPATPKAGSGVGAWASKKSMPGGQGSARGAFGWYAAMTAPNSNNQWIHGTLGWGSDKDKFIRMTRGFFANLFTDPRSHGCTRLENRAIAYARTLLPVGTEILRVYALEGYRDVTRARYQSQAQTRPWEFILTKEGVRKSGAADSDKNSVMARGVSSDLILEQGNYDIDQYPNGINLKLNANGIDRNGGQSGNTYGINDNGFRGVFLIDEGTFVSYEHPAGLPVGGYEGAAIPSSLQTSGDYVLVTKKTR